VTERRLGNRQVKNQSSRNLAFIRPVYIAPTHSFPSFPAVTHSVIRRGPLNCLYPMN